MRMARITSALLFAATIAYTSFLYAQGSPSQSAGIDDAQLKSFARVYVQIEKIRDTYAPQLKQSQDSQKNIEIQKEAKSKIDDALSKEGMTAESYSQTVQIVSADNALRSKAIEMINQERSKP
jgi:Domain of unknown function (DUF4168)